MSSTNRIIILGINGHIGGAVARAYLAAGWQVDGFGRSDRHPIPGVNFIAGDADDVASMRAAIGATQVVFNGLNLPYHEWDNGLHEALHQRVIEALGNTGKTLLFPGNIYNYAATDRVVTPDLPQRPETPRGAIRVRTEQLCRAAAARGDIQMLLIRAGDFFGPGTSGDWFDLAMMPNAHKGKVGLMGAWGVGHAWAYLPDLAQAFLKVGEARHRLGGFENFHFAGYYVTPEQMRDAIAAVAPVRTRFSLVPRYLFPLIGLFNPMMREVAKMAYLWESPMALRDPRLTAIMGGHPGTPFEDAVAVTVAPFFEREALAA